jgi:putative flippase GtrA
VGSTFLRFAAGGVVTYATTLLVMGFWLAVVGIPELVAYALTHVSVLIVGFLINRYWIFRTTAGNPAAQGVRFVLANSAFRLVDWCVYSGIALLIDPPVFLTVLSANLLVLPLKFLFYKHQVFGEAMRSVP